jgi:hypothetical protein
VIAAHVLLVTAGTVETKKDVSSYSGLLCISDKEHCIKTNVFGKTEGRPWQAQEIDGTFRSHGQYD